MGTTLAFHCLLIVSLVGQLFAARGVSLDATSAPRFVSRGQTFRAVIGDTLVLPCEVEDLGSYVLLWRRGSAVLTAASLMVTRDSRFRLVDGYNLEIGDVMPQDAGDYVCQISDGENRDQIHTVEILVPPSIRMTPSNGQLKARKGGTITLECKASGNPVPSILWSRKDNMLPTGEKAVEGFSITLEKVDRHQAGVYQCTANNGVGEPVTVDMQLDVLYPPEIEVERSWVHSGEGYEAQLACIVHAEPPADVLWYRDTLRLDPTERRIMEVRGSRRTLIIRKVQYSDFGNYSCVADNVLGKTRQYLELSGKPNRAVFHSHTMGRYRDAYNISWSVNSYTPIEEFKLFFRKLPVNPPQTSLGHNQPHNQYNKRPTRRDNDTYGYLSYGGGRGEWNDVILPAIASELHTQQMYYLIKGLESGTKYEAKVQAKNRFGWSQVSDSFQFYTRGLENSLYEPSPEPAVFAEPEVRDLGMTAYSNAGSGNINATVTLLLVTLMAYTWS